MQAESGGEMHARPDLCLGRTCQKHRINCCVCLERWEGSHPQNTAILYAKSRPTSLASRPVRCQAARPGSPPDRAPFSDRLVLRCTVQAQGAYARLWWTIFVSWRPDCLPWAHSGAHPRFEVLRPSVVGNFCFVHISKS